MKIELDSLGIRTGDDFICSGNSKLSNAIKVMNKISGVRGMAAEMTHVATAKAPPECGITSASVFESTSIGYSGVNGVQLNPIAEWLENYNGKVWLVQYDFERSLIFENNFDEFITKNLGTPYESGIAGGFELFLAGLRADRLIRLFKPDYNPCSTNNLHCTELNTLLKEYVNMLYSRVIASRMPPCQFWPGGELYKHLVYKAKVPIRLK